MGRFGNDDIIDDVILCYLGQNMGGVPLCPLPSHCLPPLNDIVYSSIVASVKTLFLKFRFGPLVAACRKMFFSKKVAHIPLLLGDITQNAGTQ